MPNHLIPPHGGTLIDLLQDADRVAELKTASSDWPSWSLTPRQMCDLELLLNGGFSPLTSFLAPADYESVLRDMRLADGTLWPIPVILDVTPDLAGRLTAGAWLALREPEGVMLAALQVGEVWTPDLNAEADAVFGTSNREHPGVAYVLRRTNSCYVTGRLEGIQLPAHYDFRNRRRSPAEMRERFTRLGWRRIAAFQTRSPMHRADYELTLRAVKDAQANLLIHPIVGMTKPGDIDHYTRVRCYQALLPHYPKNTVSLSLLPLAMRLAGPREALWLAIVEKNYGCSHLIVSRDHAGPGTDPGGEHFYDPYAAQELVGQHEQDLGVTMIPGKALSYLRDEDQFVPEDQVPPGTRTLSISSADLRARLADGREIPEWFTFPAVAAELTNAYPPRHKQGFTIFFTGLSGAGKSTIAKVLLTRFLEVGGRPVTLLDGDIVRTHLSSELGFSRQHRDLNIHRIGFVASEITKNGGIAICAPIAPYDSVRKDNRMLIEQGGGYVLVYVSTPVEVCEQRDRKGLYAKARAGIIKEFTGISDPYEVPDDADLVIDTSNVTPDEAAQQVILYLEQKGYIGANRE